MGNKYIANEAKRIKKLEAELSKEIYMKIELLSSLRVEVF